MSGAHSNESIPKQDTPKHGVPLMQEGRLMENPLSEREMEVAKLLSTGASNGEIAHTLIISPHTVKVHLRNIFEKLQVSSRTEASMLLVQRGWLTVPGVEIPPLFEESSEMVAVISTPPEPEPLSDSPFQLAGWHRLYLVASLLLATLAFFLPSLRGRANASPSLLSDAAQIGLPASEVLSLPRWQRLTPLSESRSRMALTHFDNQLFSIGGETTGGRLVKSVDSYDLALNDWHRLPELPIPLSNSAAAVISKTIYVAGGMESIGENESPKINRMLYQLHDGEPAWSTLIDLPNSLAGAAMVADEDSLYLIGGWDGGQMRDEIWRLRPNPSSSEQLAWQFLTRMSTPRAFLGAALVGRKLYVIGGSDGQHNLDENVLFDLETGKWQALSPLPTPRRGFGLVYDGAALYVIGGDGLNQVPIHQRFDISTNEWTNFPSPVQGVWRNMGVVSLNGRIYMIGGWSGDYMSTAIEYQSSYRLLLPVISKDQ